MVIYDKNHVFSHNEHISKRVLVLVSTVSELNPLRSVQGDVTQGNTHIFTQ